MLGSHLASLEVTSWPLTWSCILAFRTVLGLSQPWQGSAHPMFHLYQSLGLASTPHWGWDVQQPHSSLILPLLSDVVASASVSPSE
jgi:hypothetical protein